MESNSIAERVKAANNVVVMGGRAVEERSVFSLMGLKNLAKVALVAGVLAVSAVGFSAAYNPGGVLHGPEQTTSAQVVAKIYQQGGPELSPDRAAGEVEAWQSEVDAVGSKFRLVVAIDGENVQVPVAESVYKNYCQHTSMSDSKPVNRFDTNNPARVMDCADGQGLQAAETVSVSYARNELSGDIEITQFGSTPKAATSFLERYQLRKEFKEKFQESQDINFIKRGPSMG
jgi:hypothetical protein